jgi:hypothetical protein
MGVWWILTGCYGDVVDFSQILWQLCEFQQSYQPVEKLLTAITSG